MRLRLDRRVRQEPPNAVAVMHRRCTAIVVVASNTNAPIGPRTYSLLTVSFGPDAVMHR